MSVKPCTVCGVPFAPRRKTAKFCSRRCMGLSLRGRSVSRRPRSPEAVEKWKEAISRTLKGRPGPTHSPGVRRKISEKVRAAIAQNPEQWTERARNNLPKGPMGGANNPNWRGGTTPRIKLFRSRLVKWKKAVVARDGKCRDCESKENLEAHHILPISHYPTLAAMEWNGITLCHSCHLKLGGSALRSRQGEREVGQRIIIQTIPHHWQTYSTVGNWFAEPNWHIRRGGELTIFVSETRSPLDAILVGIHELIEAALCANAGVTTLDVDHFDEMWEREFEAGLHSRDDEPGDDPRSPYRKFHEIATMAERLILLALGENWEQYEQRITALWNSTRGGGVDAEEKNRAAS